MAEAIASVDVADDMVFTPEIASRVVAMLSPEERGLADQVARSFLPSIGRVADQIAAGLHLLSRLASRQYYSLFRNVLGVFH
jgi:hypothetical protein